MIISFRPYTVKWLDNTTDNYVYISAFDHNNFYFVDYDCTNNKLIGININNGKEFNDILKQYNIPILENNI